MGSMIDIDYHREDAAVSAMSSRAAFPPEPEENLAWSPAANPAVAALLDHLAEELAREYIRLMEQAAHNDAVGPTPSQQER